jgi:uncharacterized membrane protein
LLASFASPLQAAGASEKVKPNRAVIAPLPSLTVSKSAPFDSFSADVTALSEPGETFERKQYVGKGKPSYPKGLRSPIAVKNRPRAFPIRAGPSAVCGAMDVVFLLDDTVSMGPAIENIKAQVNAILTDIEFASGNNYRLGLLTFKDNVKVRVSLHPQNKAEFQTAIQQVTAEAGASPPEASSEALHTVLQNLRDRPQQINSWVSDFRPEARRIVILITDTYPGGFDDSFTPGVDTAFLDHLASTAADKDIQCSTILIPESNLIAPSLAALWQKFSADTFGIYRQARQDGSDVADSIRYILSQCGGPNGFYFRLNDHRYSATVSRGETRSVEMTLASFGRYSGNVTLGASGMPAGMQANFTPSSVTLDGKNPVTASLSIQVGSNVPFGLHDLTVTATAPGKVATATVRVSVLAPEFGIITASSVSIGSGSSQAITVDIISYRGFAGTISLSTHSEHAGITASVSPNSVVLGANESRTSTLTLSADASVPHGSYAVKIAGSVAGGASAQWTMYVRVAPPDIHLGVGSNGSSSIHIPRGGSASLPVSVASQNNFSGTVALSAAGMPSGMTVSFNPVSLSVTPPGQQTAQLTISAANSVPVGAYFLSITAQSGAVRRIASLTVFVYEPTQFSLSVTPSVQTIAAGSSDQRTVQVLSTPGSGFQGTVSLQPNSLPAGITAYLSQTQLNLSTGSASTTMTVQVAPSVKQGQGYGFLLFGTSNTGRQQSEFVIVEVPRTTPDFDVVAQPGSVSIIRGLTGSVTTKITPYVGFSGEVALSLSNAPTGITGTFSPNPVNLTNADPQNAALTLSVGVNMPKGTYPVTIVATKGAETRTTALYIIVPESPDFQVTSATNQMVVSQAGSGTSSVAVRPLANFFGNVSLSLTNAPAGITATFVPPTISLTGTGGVQSQFTLNVASGVPPGTYNVSLTGTGQQLVRTASLRVVVPEPDFAVSAAPRTLTLPRGESRTTQITAASISGLAGSIDLTAAGMPSGMTTSFSVNPVTLVAGGTASSTLTLTADNTVLHGQYKITVTGTVSGTSRAVDVYVTVPQPDFRLTLNPAAITIDQGASGNISVTIEKVYGFTDNVTLSVDSLPTGVTAQFTPNPATDSSTLALTIGSNTPGRVYSLTVRGTSGSRVHTAVLNLTVKVIAPEAPTNLTAKAVSWHQINLAWMDNSNREEGFRIERRRLAEAEEWAEIATVGENVTIYADPALSAETTYEYRVRAYNTGGNSAYSNIAGATTEKEPPSHQGTEFWLAVPGTLPNNWNWHTNSERPKEIFLVITANEAASGTVTIPGLHFTAAFTVPQNGSARVLLPEAVEVQGNDLIENRGVHIVANNPIQIHVLNYDATISEGYLALPPDALGREYIIVDANATSSGTAGSQFTILAIENGTLVTISPRMSAGVPGFERAAKVPYVITLNQGETYQIRRFWNNPFENSRLTGSIVSASKPVAVYGGNQSAWVTPYYGFGNHLVEQLIPVENWGTEFFALPFFHTELIPGLPYASSLKHRNSLRIVASHDGTWVRVNGDLIATLKRGEQTDYASYETQTLHNIVDRDGTISPLHVTSNYPILVTQFSHGQEHNLVWDYNAWCAFFAFVSSYQSSKSASCMSGRFACWLSQRQKL